MSLLPPEPAQLAPLLAEWLPRQRWFGGHEVSVDDVHAVARLTDEPAISELVVVQTPSAAYQVPLLFRADRLEGLDHAHVGTVETDGGTAGATVEVYDALHDKSVTGAWLRGIAAGAEYDGIRFVRDDAEAELPVDQPSLVMGAEQSNTSLVYGHEAILKVFRRLEPGANPDIEVHAALGELGARHVARLLGHVRIAWPGGDREVTADAAMLQVFLSSATDGWQLAQISVRDLLAEGDLHADEVGGDFAGESHRLGVATAETHADLASALGTGSLDAEGLRALAAGMRERLDRVLADVGQLEPYADGLRTIFDRVADLPGPLPVQRVHGDYHLGQVLRTTQRWVLLDFEGEPLKPFAERVGLDSPLRDVAGMLRSFDYAARQFAADRPHDPQVAYRVEEWSTRNRTAFLDGYAEGLGGRDLRADPALLTLLTAYEADKAVYEVRYEAGHRPSWLPIPLAAVARLVQDGA